jgi:cytochrome oxidase Cu insertion factor (SCO1/SenC/PrrC family)
MRGMARWSTDGRMDRRRDRRGEVLTRSSRRRGAIKRGTVMTLVAMAAALIAFTSIARADGDPASDYLLTRQVFLSSQSNTESRAQRQLLTVVGAANRAGFAIRVALVPSEYDLGSITALWRKPRLYARFLGLELSLAYKQRLLVVMPNGFGINWPGHSASPAYRVLSDVRIGAGDGTLAAAAQTAVTRLAAAAGVKIAPPSEAASGVPATANTRGSEKAIIAVIAVAMLVAVILLLVRRRRRRTGPHASGKPSSAASGASTIQRRWAVSAFAALLVLATGTPIVLLVAFRHPAASGVPVGSVVTPPPFGWPAGRRAAPEFVLRDQYGRRVSVSEYRGRSLIVTFVDPLCRNLCPLEAHLLNQVVAGMPASRRPAIVAVSVDVYADANARANLIRDVHKWELVPQWHWAVGSRAQLAAVWKRYEIGVSVTTKRIAGTSIHYITHTEGAYIIDATGHERALFLWPFYPQDVERSLRQFS